MYKYLSMTLLITSIAQAQEVSISRELNQKEETRLEKFLTQKANSASGQQEKEVWEEKLHAFYKKQFDNVIMEINELGENIQKILKVTGLRGKLLLGYLEKMPWFIKAIAAIDFHFKIDKTILPVTDRQFRTIHDKIYYLESLTFQLAQNQDRITEKELLLEAIADLTHKFIKYKDRATGVFAKKLKHNLLLLKELKEHYLV